MPLRQLEDEIDLRLIDGIVGLGGLTEVPFETALALARMAYTRGCIDERDERVGDILVRLHRAAVAA